VIACVQEELVRTLCSMQVYRDIYDSRKTLLGFGSMGILWGAFAAFIPRVKAQIDVGDAMFGLIISCAALGLMAAMAAAPTLDRRLRRFAMPAAIAALATAYLGLGTVSTAVGFTTVMFVVAFASGLADIVINARISETEARTGRSLMNLNHAGFSLAYACGAIVTGFAREADWQTWVVFALLAVVVCAACIKMPMRTASETEPDASKGGRLPIGVIVWGGIIVLIAFETEGASEAWSALHVERTLGGGAAEGAFGPAMLGLTMAVGRFSGHLISGRVSGMKIIVAASMFAANGAWLAAAATSPNMAYVGFGILGLGISVIAPTALNIVGERVGIADRTLVIARVSIIGFAGFFLGPPVIGLLAEYHGLRVAFATVGCFLLMILPATMMLKRQGPKA
jgi:MFS family permease